MTADDITAASVVDDETLRYIGQLFGRRDSVQRTSLFPSNKLESLVVTLNDEYYPKGITDVTIEIRAYTSGDFHVSSIEIHSGERRRCRWDRHEQPHSSRDHYHPLPDARTESAIDRAYATDLTHVLEMTVLPWIDERIGQLWSDRR